MSRREVVAILRKAGFVIHRNGSKHQLWRHPRTGFTVPVSYGTNGAGNDVRTLKNMKANLKRAGLL